MQKNTSLNRFSNKTSFFITFFLILAVSIGSYQIIESKLYVSGKFHFGLSYVCTFLVGAIGYWGISNSWYKWAKTLWAGLYIGATVVFLLAKTIDAFIFSIPFKPFLYKINALFLSPFPFLAFSIVLQKLRKADNKQV